MSYAQEADVNPHADRLNDAEVGGIAADRLRSLVERYERLAEEVAGIKSDQKDLLQECASAGFDKKVFRQIIAIRKREPGEVENERDLLDLYMRALGA